MQSWMNSPGHPDNILNPQFRELGVGYYFLANNTGTVNYKHYWNLGFWYTRVGFAVSDEIKRRSLLPYGLC
ncbi:hypothetical protein ANSO36C_64670 (plasmid) [Nostoc cf. commune SO-36]|uniref:SCP domain-containing protein n=2 Tax=Nostoc commune TaxID=1178 RepID=A0ABN6QEH0_NOSCO|nr:hypothetical protein ANSO36C_64670 [Nostoc cf. commune SO-36]